MNKALFIMLLRELFIGISMILASSFMVFFLSGFSAAEQNFAFTNSISDNDIMTNNIIIQYLFWLKGACIGQYGNSIIDGYPVIDKIKFSFFRSFLLIGGSFLFCLITSVGLTIFHFIKGNKIIKMAKLFLNFFIFVLSTIPLFLIGYIVFLNYYTEYVNVMEFEFSSIGSEFVYYATPILLLGIGNGVLLTLRDNMINEVKSIKNKYYIRSIISKNGKLFKYTIRAILLPIISVFNIHISFFIGGTIIIERIFNWYGVGYLSWDAAINHDYPLLIAIIFFTSILVRILEIINRTLVYVLEPRLRT